MLGSCQSQRAQVNMGSFQSEYYTEAMVSYRAADRAAPKKTQERRGRHTLAHYSAGASPADLHSEKAV